MKYVWIEAKCELVGEELPGRNVLKWEEHFFTVPVQIIQNIWEDDEIPVIRHIDE